MFLPRSFHGAYSTMAVAAFIGLVWQLRMADMTVAAVAPVGAVFTFIALFTGAAWGKPMWGTWWVWDARLTSELILLFLYLGVIALYNAFSDKVLAGRAAGILALVGVINLPSSSTTRWSGGTPCTRAPASPSLEAFHLPEMLWPLLIMILALPPSLGAPSPDAFSKRALDAGVAPPLGQRDSRAGEVSMHFASFSDFLAMGGYAFYVWLSSV